MTDDVRTFTVTTLSFVLMVFNSSLTILTFFGVLWSINPLLFVVAVLYAACGSYLTIGLGRPLINLNYDQLDKEASFRSSLIHVRENAEPILLARGEERQGSDLTTWSPTFAASSPSTAMSDFSPPVTTGSSKSYQCSSLPQPS